MSRFLNKTPTGGIECETANGLALTPQIAVVQVKVKGVLLALASQLLVVPGSARQVPSSQPILHTEKNIKCHTYSHSMLYAVYIPFLWTTYRYFKPKQIQVQADTVGL